MITSTNTLRNTKNLTTTSSMVLVREYFYSEKKLFVARLILISTDESKNTKNYTKTSTSSMVLAAGVFLFGQNGIRRIQNLQHCFIHPYLKFWLEWLSI